MSSSIINGRTAASVRWLSLFGGLTLSLAACSDSVAPRSSVTESAPAPAFARGGNAPIADEYIVVFKDDVHDVRGKALGLLKNGKGVLKHSYSSAIKGFSAHMSAEEAAQLAADPSVAYVEQDQEVTISETQSGATWGLDRIDQSSLPLNGSYSYDLVGAGVNVYIVDTGIRTSHSQFGGRAVAAYTSVADGYGPQGCHWHGTHVAGTVGGSTVGVAKGVRLYSVRVLDCAGSGTTAGVVAGIDWIAANHVRPAVANMSVSGGLSPALNDAVQRASGLGITFAVAAGNNADNACNYSPASAGVALTVGASTSADFQASFSNWGGCVDMFAPGNAVYSAWNTDDGSMGTASGTSMATPHVAGAAALYLQVNPGASPEQVASALLSSSTGNALNALGAGSPNRLLRVNGSGGGTVTPPPPPPPPPPPSGNVAPQASFVANCPSNKNNCSFDASSSSDDSGIASFSWAFGDGSSSVSAANPRASHSYNARGSYVVTLTVRDISGLTSSTQRTVNVKSIAR